MLTSIETSEKTASFLLKIKAIKLQPDNPFTWASGWKSPIYCDNRIILSFPEVRNYVCNQMANHIRMNYPQPDVIAGVATGAIGIGMLVANVLDLPFIYVRPEAKSHGRQNQIEGQVLPKQKVVVIEDLISTGNSSLNAVTALKEAQVEVLGMLAIFTYGFEVAQHNFKTHNIKLDTLSNYEALLNEALKTNYITNQQALLLSQWNANPSEWAKK